MAKIQRWWLLVAYTQHSILIHSSLNLLLHRGILCLYYGFSQSHHTPPTGLGPRPKRHRHIDQQNRGQSRVDVCSRRERHVRHSMELLCDLLGLHMEVHAFEHSKLGGK